MLQTIIEAEKRRLARDGYDAVVAMDEITVFDNMSVTQLGNDTVIITRIVFDENAVGGDNPRISIACPTSSIVGSVRNLASFGTGMYKVMRNYVVVRRLGSTTSELPMTFHIVRITPKKWNK